MQRRLLSKVLYIPMICIGSFLLGNECNAASSASLTIATPNMTSDAIAPGSTAATSTNVTVDVKDADSYKLYISFSNTNLTGGSTTIQAGNAISNNTWGYKWDNASSYTTPSTSDVELTVPALVNNATNFTKTLSFAAKFSSDAVSGTYHASGNLKLVATPKMITNVYTLAFDKNDTSSLKLLNTSVQRFNDTFPKQTSPATSADSYTFTIPSTSFQAGRGIGGTSCGYMISGWTTESNSSTKEYDPGATITVQKDNPDVTLYAFWIAYGGCSSEY